VKRGYSKGMVVRPRGLDWDENKHAFVERQVPDWAYPEGQFLNAFMKEIEGDATVVIWGDPPTEYVDPNKVPGGFFGWPQWTFDVDKNGDKDYDDGNVIWSLGNTTVEAAASDYNGGGAWNIAVWRPEGIDHVSITSNKSALYWIMLYLSDTAKKPNQFPLANNGDVSLSPGDTLQDWLGY